VVPHVKVAPERPANSSRVVTTGGDDLLCLLCAMRAEMRGFAALLCRRWVAVTDAADRRDEMGLPGDSRGIRVRRNTSQHNSPVCLSRMRYATRLAAWSGALASDMCKKRRVVALYVAASSYSRCGPDPTWLA
jgi:hypothetical protein